MAAFGTLTLLIALVVATYSGVISLIGARRGNRRFIEAHPYRRRAREGVAPWSPVSGRATM